MYSTFLLCFFLLFFLSPFAFLSFYTVDYIKSCTLHCSIVSYNQTLFPPRFAPRLHPCFVPFDLRTSAQHSQPSPITSLLFRTQFAPFAHPYTCDCRCLFCFGHGQRCASPSPLHAPSGTRVKMLTRMSPISNVHTLHYLLLLFFLCCT